MVAPVEYAVAVDRYLASARISPASQRVYRVTLATWGWLLVGRTPPTGTARRGAHSPSSLWPVSTAPPPRPSYARRSVAEH